jgi:transcriptional regulator GlxA family with amidase domain
LVRRPIQIAILATPEVEPWVALGIHDAFWAVGVLWNRVMGEPEAPAFAPQIVSTDGAMMQTSTGVNISPQGTLASLPRPDIIFVPSILIASGAEFGRNNPDVLRWMREAHANGSRVVSSCTGSFALAEAGLLDGRETTTHWAFVEPMRKEYPAIKVRGDRIIVTADEDGSIVTAGGATSWTDLVLYLVGRFVSQEEARRLAKMSLFDWHHQGQNPYARLVTKPQRDDAAIHAVQEWAADNYAAPDIVSAMTAHAQLTEKTFARRFKAATGFAPLEYVQRLRIEESKQLLETRDSPIEAIGEQVGYADAASFRRLFKRYVGESPGEYRRRCAVPDHVRKLPT